jgi:hypothetical protein
MKVLNRYPKVLFLLLSLFFLTQGCSFYARFHTESAPSSGTATAQGGSLNEMEAPETGSIFFGDTGGAGGW